MIDLLRHLCASSATTADGVDEVVDWVLRWVALPLQQPGTKMQTALVFHGPQGTGKNLFFDVWRDLYGRYGVTVGQTELEDKFNDWLSCKLAIVGDEVVSRQEMYHHKNKLKLVVTQETKFPIRAIQQSVRWESNHANVVFLSNESQPLALEERDRRYMVVYTPVASDEALYTRVADFLKAGGAAKWLHYLLAVQLGDFTRHTKPLLTQAKTDLIEMGWKPAERFAHEWLEGFLPLPVRVCSTEQLYRAFRRWCDQQGERWPPSQALFSKGVERWASERGRRGEEAPLRCKVVKLQHVTGQRKCMRCWLPRGCDPTEGQTEGAWASSGVDDFEASLRSFVRQASAVGDAE
jgi:putative DNA primase/helicase